MEKYDGLSIKETFSFWSDAWKDMPGVKDVASSIGSDISNTARGLSDKVENKITKMAHNYDDGIVVPEGTKTLLGEDFKALYGGSNATVAAMTTSGIALNELTGTDNYSTEMLSSNLTSSTRRLITTMQPEKRAAYEVVLLSKNYSYQYKEGNDAVNDALSEQYASKMASYRQACEQSGTSWAQVMQYASWELQAEGATHQADSRKFMNSQESEADRLVSNRAHGMLLECAPEGWEDTLWPHLNGDITYEETLDTNPQSVGFAQNIGRWFSEKWHNITDTFASAWQKLKDAVPRMMDTADAIVVAGDLAHEQNMEMYRNTYQDASEKVGEVTDKAKEVGGKVADKANEYWNKAKDELGLSDEQQEEGQSLEMP